MLYQCTSQSGKDLTSEKWSEATLFCMGVLICPPMGLKKNNSPDIPTVPIEDQEEKSTQIETEIDFVLSP